MNDQIPQPVIRLPGDNTGVVLRGEPMAFLVTGKDTKHTSMFDWTVPRLAHSFSCRRAFLIISPMSATDRRGC